MGYLTELNTMLGLPKGFDTTQLVVGKKYIVTKDRERVFPLHLALLMVTSEWDFLGYAVAHSAQTKDQKTTIEFEVISLFPPKEQRIYKNNYLSAGKITGEIK